MMLNILTLSLLLVFAGCSHRSYEMPERPSSGEPDDPELLDDGMRISGEVLSMRYDDCGILFSITPEGKISAVRLADDIGFVFDPAGPALSVNGKAVGLDSAEMIKEADGCKWFKLITAGGRQKIYIVVSI